MAYVFARAGEFNVVAGAPGNVRVDTFHYLRFVGIGPDFCPPPPYLVNMRAAFAGPAAANQGEMIFGPFEINPGPNVIPIDFEFPTSAPGIVDITIESEITFMDGMVLSQTQNQEVCVVADAGTAFSSGPLLPRISITPVDPSPTIRLSHPGEHVQVVYTIENNGDTEFNGFVTATSHNVAVPADVVVPSPDPDKGMFSSSDPVGDAFPVGLRLLDGTVATADADCLDFPPDPNLQLMTEDELPITIPAAGSIQVGLRSASYPPCADGSCNQASLKVFEGTNVAPGDLSACAGVVSAASTAVTPSFDKCGSGTALLATTFFMPGGTSIGFQHMDSPLGGPWTVGVVPDASGVALTANGAPVTKKQFFSSSDIRAEQFGRLLTAFVGPTGQSLFAGNTTIGVTIPFRFSGATTGNPVTPSGLGIKIVPNAPTGFSNDYPFALGAFNVNFATQTAGVGFKKALVDFHHQFEMFVRMTGKTNVTPMTVDSITATPAGDDTYEVNMTAHVPGGTAEETVEVLAINNDFASYARPPVVDEATTFKRCDANGDGSSNVADAVWVVNELFRGGPASMCQQAADCNDDGFIDDSDASFALNFRFLGGAAPPAPGPDACGADSTLDDLGCDSYPPSNCDSPAAPPTERDTDWYFVDCPRAVTGTPGTTVSIALGVEQESNLPGAEGVQGWSLSLGFGGVCQPVDAIVGEAGLNADFRHAEPVDPDVIDDQSGEPQGEGVVSGVVLSLGPDGSLDPQGRAGLLDVAVNVNVPVSNGAVTCGGFFGDGRRGSGEPVENLVVLGGQARRPDVGDGCAFPVLAIQPRWRTDKFADSDKLLPGTEDPIQMLGAPSITGRRRVFFAAEGKAGIYLSDDELLLNTAATNDLREIVGTNDLIPGTKVRFASFFSHSSNGRTLGFTGADAAFEQLGMYLRDVDDPNAPIVPVFTGGGGISPSDFATDRIFGAHHTAGVSGGEHVAFSVFRPTSVETFGTTGPAIFVAPVSDPTQSRLIADAGTPIPEGKGNFTSFGGLSLAGQRLVFDAFGLNQQAGVYMADFSGVDVVITKVADKNTPIPSGSGTFNAFSSVSFDGLDVGFRGRGVGPQDGVYRTLGGGALVMAANLDTPIPDGTGNFIEFSTVSLYEQDVAFLARGADVQQGLYLGSFSAAASGAIATSLTRGAPSATLSKIVAHGDPLDGKFVEVASISREALDENVVGFHVRFTDESQGLFTTTRILLGDDDGDGDRDLRDVSAFLGCFTDTDGLPSSPECAESFDADGDDDVDLTDFLFDFHAVPTEITGPQ